MARYPSCRSSLDEVGADRFAEGVLVVPHGHRHVRGAGLLSEPHRRGQVGAVPGAVLRAGRVGAVALVAGGTGRQDLACRGGLAGGVEAEELDDPGAVDGVVEGLPGLEAGEWRLPGVEEQERGDELEAGVDPGRVPDGERAVRLAVQG